MTKLDVAYGVPDRVSESRLLEALQVVTNNFDEAPVRMHAVFGPPGRVRWFTFACSSLGPGQALAQDHFSESMDLDELIVVTRSIYGDVPQVARGGDLLLARGDGGGITVFGTLPANARRDGDVDQILLGALGLDDAMRPFAALAAPTHEVVLREARKRVQVAAVTPLVGPVLPTRVNPRIDVYFTPSETFAATPRAVDVTDRGALEAHLAAVSTKVEGEWIQTFEREFDQRVGELVRVGPAIGPVLVEFLADAGRKTRTARVALAGLASLGTGAEAMIAWATKPSEVPRHAGYAALWALGERARDACLAACASTRSSERMVAEAVLAMLDGSDWAPVRAARTASRGPISRPGPIDRWEMAAHFIATPCEWWARYALLHRAVAQHGAEVAPVADQLLRFPPFAKDVQLAAIAHGQKLLDPRAQRAKAKAKPKKPAAKKPAATRLKKPRAEQAKKPAAKKPAAKKSAAKKPAAKKSAAKRR